MLSAVVPEGQLNGGMRLNVGPLSQNFPLLPEKQQPKTPRFTAGAWLSSRTAVTSGDFDAWAEKRFTKSVLSPGDFVLNGVKPCVSVTRH